jgi:hypothetical protein
MRRGRWELVGSDPVIAELGRREANEANNKEHSRDRSVEDTVA